LVLCYFIFFFFKQKTAYEMRISDWSSDVCSSDLRRCPTRADHRRSRPGLRQARYPQLGPTPRPFHPRRARPPRPHRGQSQVLPRRAPGRRRGNAPTRRGARGRQHRPAHARSPPPRLQRARPPRGRGLGPLARRGELPSTPPSRSSPRRRSGPRRGPMTRMIEHDPSDRDRIPAVEATHRAFYAAWEAADIASAAQLWLDSEDISIGFPGGPPTWGRDAVLEHLAEAMEFTRGIQFLFEDLRFAVRGDVARLTCIEHVLMPGDQSFEKVTDAPPSRLAVSSTLVRTEVGWRLWSHMSGPILTDVERE